jgi:hypothetical protein
MTAPSSAALRMRRSRDRRRQGDVIVSLEVGPKVTADLVDLGWLPAPDCDKDALSHALIDLIERAIRARVSPSTGSEEGKVCFFCEIKRSTFDTLVEEQHRDRALKLAVEVNLVADETYEPVRTKRVAERLCADQRPVVKLSPSGGVPGHHLALQEAAQALGFGPEAAKART